jgi:hypothetical protein
MEAVSKNINMKYLIHTPSDVRELENEEFEFEIIGQYDDRRQWPLIIEFATPDEGERAINLGLVAICP